MHDITEAAKVVVEGPEDIEEGDVVVEVVEVGGIVVVVVIGVVVEVVEEGTDVVIEEVIEVVVVEGTD